MNKTAGWVLLVTVLAVLVAGCGDFRRRAEQVESRIAAAQEAARVAEQAAARNTARILDLEERVERLEAAVIATEQPASGEGNP